MQILTVDVGTGTQDILLFDSERTPENCLKLVVPSPTLLLGNAVRAATETRLPVAISGLLMGGGPVSWAVEAHHRAGLPIFATPDAARTFNDDLDQVREDLGVELVSEDEIPLILARKPVVHVHFQDFDYPAIDRAFASFGLQIAPDAVALAVFDHGAAPPGVSDRLFRMNYLADRLRERPDLTALAFKGVAVPPEMTRLGALVRSAHQQVTCPVFVMDTAPAAVLGALEDPIVSGQSSPVVVNVGNFHSLAFQFENGRFLRLFEHHTGEVTRESLATWIGALASGAISHDRVFDDHGHGALVLDSRPVPLMHVAVVGPRRTLLHEAGLPTYFAVPHGDQMLAGCYGLLRAVAALEPAWREPIQSALAGKTDRSLW